MQTEKSQYELSIVMPCLNEAETLAHCIRQAQTYLLKNQIVGEIIIADNGSIDGSQQIAQDMGADLINVSERGYGAAVSGGIKAANGKYVIMGDSDASYSFSDLNPFLKKLREGYALVMGNRFQGGIEPGAMPFLHRYLGNPLLSFIGRLFFHIQLGDFHCGLRGFHRDSIVNLDLRTTGMEFASEMIVKSALAGLRLTEVPIVLSPDGRSRPPYLRTWRDGWRHLRFLLLYSPRWLFLYPGIGLFLLGLFLTIWLLPAPRQIGAIHLDVNTLFYALLITLLGAQSVSFAFFTKIFAISEGLLPEDPRLTRIYRWLTLERGLLIGAFLVVLGLAGSVAALANWGEKSFGNLDPVTSLRLVIPAGGLIALGIQILLSSFFFSILGLKRK